MQRAGSLAFLLFLHFLLPEAFSQEVKTGRSLPDHSKLSYQAYDALSLPLRSPDKHNIRGGIGNSLKNAADDPVIIAVVDDAFRLSHKDLKDFIYQNPWEMDTNGIDDDGNGKTDDLHGWDISDNDNDVSPPAGREEEYYHGTMIAGSIITVLKIVYGDDAQNRFKILPVKVLSDHEKVPFLRDGYRGIAYATEQGADIICCAWSGGEVSEEEREIIDAARMAGIALIGSAGNAYSEKVDNPAALDGVLAVAGVDAVLKKTPDSNYGAGVDLVAPARDIRTTHPLADNAFFYGGGTSGAAGIVTGCIAVLKSVLPCAPPEVLFEALINTANPVNRMNPSYAGKLGAGIPVLEDAVQYLLHPDTRESYFSSERTRGRIYLDRTEGRNSYDFRTEGAMKGFTFTLSARPHGKGKRFSEKQKLTFYSNDSLFYSTNLVRSPSEIFIPGSDVKLKYSDNRVIRRYAVSLSYAAVPVDSSSLYCSGTSFYSLPSGTITDGSGEKNYAGNSSCMWQIAVDKGAQINFRFSSFDTEASVDFVYLFDGELSIPENLIAKFSGPQIPPQVTSRTNKVLVWFVTDEKRNGKGWELQYSAVTRPD